MKLLLSEYNILNYNDKPIIIDLSHGVRLDYPNALELLHRDLKNLKIYFNKFNIKIDADELLENIKKS